MKKPYQTLEANFTNNMKQVIHRRLSNNILRLSLIILIAFSTSLSAQEGDPAAGKALFNTNCASCHKLDKKMTGPALRNVEARLANFLNISPTGTIMQNLKWLGLLSEEAIGENFKTPMLVVHGAYDFRVPFSQAMELFTSLQRMNVESKLLYFPDETHFVVKPQNAKLWWNTIYDWLDKHKK